MAQGPPPCPSDLGGPTRVTLRLLRWFRDMCLANWIVSSPTVVVRRRAGGTCSLEAVGVGGARMAKVGGAGLAVASWDGTDATPSAGLGTLLARTDSGWSETGGAEATLYNASTGGGVDAGALVLVNLVDGRWVVAADFSGCP